MLEQQGCLTELGVGRLVELADSDIGGNRVEAAGVDNLRSGLLRYFVVVCNVPRNPWRRRRRCRTRGRDCDPVAVRKK